jgi:hypothetical protein
MGDTPRRRRYLELSLLALIRSSKDTATCHFSTPKVIDYFFRLYSARSIRNLLFHTRQTSLLYRPNEKDSAHLLARSCTGEQVLLLTMLVTMLVTMSATLQALRIQPRIRLQRIALGKICVWLSSHECGTNFLIMQAHHCLYVCLTYFQVNCLVEFKLMIRHCGLFNSQALLMTSRLASNEFLLLPENDYLSTKVVLMTDFVCVMTNLYEYRFVLFYFAFELYTFTSIWTNSDIQSEVPFSICCFFFFQFSRLQ